MPSGSIGWEYHPKEELVLRFKPPIGKILPNETKSHVIAASKEVLLVLKGLVDAAIAGMEEAEKKTEKRRTKIKVE